MSHKLMMMLCEEGKMEVEGNVLLFCVFIFLHVPCVCAEKE